MFRYSGTSNPKSPEVPKHIKGGAGKHSQAAIKVARVRNRARGLISRENALQAPLPTLPRVDESIPIEDYPEYPEGCIELTKECRQEYLLPMHIANVPSRTTYS